MIDFKRFERANSLHKNSEYTICDFLHFVRCVMLDIIDNCGSIEEWPVGNEDTVGDLLTNQCDALGRIMNVVQKCQKNSNERLNKLNLDIEKMKEQSEQYKDICGSVADMKKQKQELEQKLNELNEQKKKYDELDEKIKKTKQDISNVDGFDLETTKELLEKLESELNRKTKNIDELNNNIKDCREKCDAAKRYEDSLQQQLDKLKAESENTNNTLNELKTDVSKKEREKEGLEKNICVLNDAFKALNGELAVYGDVIEGCKKAFEEEKDHLSQENRTKIADVEKLTQDVLELRETHKTLRDKAEQLEKDKSQLEKSVETVKALVELLNCSTDEYTNRIEGYSVNLRFTKSELSETYSDLLADVESIGKEIGQLYVSIKKKSEQKDRLVIKLEALRKNDDSIQAAIDSLQNSEEDFCSKVEDYIRILNETQERLSEQCGKKHTEAVSMCQKVQKLQDEVEILDNEVHCSEVKAEELKNAKKNILETSDRINKIISGLDGDMSELEEIFQGLDSRKTEHMQKAESKLEEDYQRLNDEYNRFYYGTLKILLDNNRKVNEKIKNENEELQTAQNTNNDLQEKLDKLNNEVSRLAVKNEDLRDDINRKNTNLSRVKQEYDKLYHENGTINDNIASLTARNEQLEKKLIPEANKFLESCRSITDSHEKTVREKAAELCKLIEQLNVDLMREMSSFNKKVTDELKKLTNIRKEYEEKISRISEYDDEIKEKQAQICELEEKNDKEQREGAIQQLNDKINKLKEDIEARKDEIKCLEKSIKELTEEYNGFKSKKDELDKQNQSFTAKRDALKSECRDIEELLGDNFLNKLNKIEKRLNLLKPLSDNLSKMMGYISEISDKEYIIPEQQRVNIYNCALNDLNDVFTEIRKCFKKASGELSDLMKLEEE